MASKNADGRGVSSMRRFYLVLTAAAVATAVTVSAAAAQTPASGSRERPALGSTITVSALGELPANENALSLLDAAQADLISDRLDTGGVSAADPARMGAHGSTWTQTRFQIGPADITDPNGDGSPLLLPGLLAWDRLDVSTGLIPLDQNAPGLAVTFQPRRAGTSWTRTIDAAFAPPGLLSRTVTTNPPAITRLNSWNYADLFAAGPLVPGRVGLVVSGDWTRASHFERSDPTVLDASIGSGFGHLEFTPSERDNVRTIVWVQHTRAPFANRNALGEPAAADRHLAVHAQARWERRLASDLTWSTFGSYTGRDREPDVAAAPAITIERLRDGPVPSLLASGTGLDAVWSAGTRAVLPTFSAFGRQQTGEFGAEFSGALARSRPGFTGTVGETVNGLPARVWVYEDDGRLSRRDRAAIAVYASDPLRVDPRIGGRRDEPGQLEQLAAARIAAMGDHRARRAGGNHRLRPLRIRAAAELPAIWRS